MPSRKNVVKYDTTELQGDDSFVVIRKMTMKEVDELKAAIGELRNKQNEVVKRLAVENGLDYENLTEEQRNELLGESEETNMLFRGITEQLSKFVIKWNWVQDEDGEVPFEQPHNNPAVFDELTTEEFKFIQTLFMSEGAEKK